MTCERSFGRVALRFERVDAVGYTRFHVAPVQRLELGVRSARHGVGVLAQALGQLHESGVVHPR